VKVFLTGGTGVIGTRALPALVADGHAVMAVARGPEKADLVRRLGGTPVEVDLFDAAAVKAAVDGSEAVVNLATAIPPLSKASRRKAWALNDRIRTEVSGHLVDAALATGVARHVQESICFPYVDGGTSWITEESPTDHGPGPFHGAAMAEANTARLTAGGGIGVVLRFAQFVAVGSSHTTSMNAFLRRRVNPFIGDPDGFVSSVHIDDAAAAVVVALRAPAGTYNVGDDEPLTRHDAGAACAARLGVKPPHPIPRVALKAGGSHATAIMRSLRVSHARFTEVTGWTPTHPSLRTYWPDDADESPEATS